ncbi:MAG: hypothetical protein AAFQ84_03660 [Pseudomonadota bacterium]
MFVSLHDPAEKRDHPKTLVFTAVVNGLAARIDFEEVRHPAIVLSLEGVIDERRLIRPAIDPEAAVRLHEHAAELVAPLPPPAKLLVEFARGLEDQFARSAYG